MQILFGIFLGALATYFFTHPAAFKAVKDEIKKSVDSHKTTDDSTGK